MADRALRISFLYRDGAISIQSATVANKRAPASVHAEILDPGYGVWLELHDDKRVVYRRLVSAQFEKEAEVFGGGPQEPFTRVALTLPSEVEVAVPLPADSDRHRLRLVLIERSARGERPRSAATSTVSDAKHEGAERHIEKQHIDMALSDLVNMRLGGK